MDDDITKAIDSLDSASAGVVPATPIPDAASLAESSNMPPIVRPGDDIGTPSFESNPVEIPLASILEPVEQVPTNIPSVAVPEEVVTLVAEPETAIVPEIPEVTEIDTSTEVPEATIVIPTMPIAAVEELPAELPPIEQTYAPMPEIAGIEMSVSKPEYTPMPTFGSTSTPNPAMVDDPLYKNENISETQRVAVDGSMISNMDSNVPVNPTKAPINNQKTVRNVIIYSSMTAIGIGIIVGVFFGYKAYSEQSSLSTLSKAAKAFVTAKSVSESIDFASDGGNIKITYDVDSDSNKRVYVSSSAKKYSLIKLKSKDSVYFGSSTTQESAKIRSFTEYSNQAKTTDYVGVNAFDIAKLLDTSALFTKDSLRYIKAGGSEIIDGKPTRKYVFSPSKEMIKAYIDSLSKSIESETVTIPDSLVITIWIDKNSGNISKIAGISKGSPTDEVPAAANADNIVTHGLRTAVNSTFSISVKYGFSENIKLPIGSKITTKIDMMKLYDDNFGVGAASKLKDGALKTTVDALKAATDTFFTDVGSYPEATNTTELLTILSAGDNPYLTENYDVSNIGYTFDETARKYIISYTLNHQDATGINISGVAPFKQYIVTN